jgi:glyoxylase-like metal-dependent hydrolase (beta-lactamase superfamily II)
VTPSAPLPHFLHPLSHGIHAVDTGFHREVFDAAYLMVHQGRALFIDTGTNHSVPRLLASLDALGLPRSAVDWVIPTHVHLDHAGGVGLLMQSLPKARLLVHPRGARHLIDPQALVAGATAVYGEEEMQRSYGQIVGVPAERVVQSHDGQVLDFHGRPLLLIDTPGHARHHHCIYDETSGGWFTGDTFGLSYREFDTARGPWLLPTCTPVQFEPAALKASVQRMLDRSPLNLYLTHFSRIGPDAALVQRLGAELLEQIDEVVQVAEPLRQHPNAADRHAALKHSFARLMLRRVQMNGCTMSDEAALQLLAIDLELNAQGTAVWLDRQSAA